MDVNQNTTTFVVIYNNNTIGCIMENKIVIVGDVINSRKEFEPKKWLLFQDSINEINQIFKDELEIPFTIYSGDSFGAVCSDIKSAIKVILKINEIQRFSKSRLVIVEDQIPFGLEQKNFLELEGPALWETETSLNLLKKNKNFFLANLKNEQLNLLVNTVLNLILTLKNEWSDQQWIIYEEYRNGSTQKYIADKMGITQQYVSKLIIQSKCKLISETEQNLMKIIDGTIFN